MRTRIVPVLAEVARTAEPAPPSTNGDLKGLYHEFRQEKPAPTPAGELRTFRADRIDGASIGEPVEPPEPGFDPVAHVVEMLARGPWGWEIEVRLDAPLDELAARVPRTLAEVSPDGAGTRLELRAESLDWAAGFLAGLGVDFDVVRPDELREPLARLANRLAQAAQA